MNTPAPIITLKPLYLDRESAAAYLSISSSLLEKLVAKGAAPKPRGPRQLVAGHPPTPGGH